MSQNTGSWTHSYIDSNRPGLLSRIVQIGAPGWLNWLGVSIWLGLWSWGCGIKHTVCLPLLLLSPYSYSPPTPLSLLLLSPCLCSESSIWVCVRIQGRLTKVFLLPHPQRFRIQKVKMGPWNLHFKQVPWWSWHHWMGATLWEPWIWGQGVEPRNATIWDMRNVMTKPAQFFFLRFYLFTWDREQAKKEPEQGESRSRERGVGGE